MTDFWHNKRVLITGHTGFIGSWVTLLLHHQGAKIMGLANGHFGSPSTFTELDLHSCVSESLEHDITKSCDGIFENVRRFNPQIILHLAGQAQVREALKNPVETYSVNVLGTIHILDLARKLKEAHADFRVLLNVTSDKVYEYQEKKYWHKESDSLGSADPYGASKVCSEIVTRSFRDTFLRGCALLTARSGGLIGGGDWSSERLMPMLVGALTRGEQMPLKQPQAIRPWQHIVDPIRGFFDYVEEMYEDPIGKPSSLNFGSAPSADWSVGRVVETATIFWSGNGHAVGTLALNSAESPISYPTMDSQQAWQFLGWRPALTVESSIRETVTWYREFLNGERLNLRSKMIHTFMNAKERQR